MMKNGTNDGYLQFVEQEAKKLNKLFILDSGEGNDFEDPKTGWYIEDLSGWLIEENKLKMFSESKKKNQHYSEFGNDYVFVRWSLTDSGIIGINFKNYSSY